MSSETLDPLSYPLVWDIVQIGGVDSPGVCEVGEFKRHAEFDVKKSKGIYGATITYTGRPPAKGEITFWLWSPSQFQAWANFRTLFKYNPTVTAINPIDIFHPSLADIDIYSVVCESIGNIVHHGLGLYTCKVELLEYFPPPAVSAVDSPSGSVSSTSFTPVGPDAVLPSAAPGSVESQIPALQAQLAQLAQQP